MFSVDMENTALDAEVSDLYMCKCTHVSTDSEE